MNAAYAAEKGSGNRSLFVVGKGGERMYPVSSAFLQAVQGDTRKYYWTGKITIKNGVVYEFGAEDIVKGSGYISSQCCGSTEIELGQCMRLRWGSRCFRILADTHWKIKGLIKLARGFRNLGNMIALIYLKCSDIVVPLCNRPQPSAEYLTKKRARANELRRLREGKRRRNFAA